MPQAGVSAFWIVSFYNARMLLTFSYNKRRDSFESQWYIRVYGIVGIGRVEKKA